MMIVRVKAFFTLSLAFPYRLPCTEPPDDVDRCSHEKLMHGHLSRLVVHLLPEPEDEVFGLLSHELGDLVSYGFTGNALADAADEEVTLLSPVST